MADKQSTLLLVLMGISIIAAPAAAEILIFNTSDNQFDVGVDNQGWWCDKHPNYDENDNYATGIHPLEDASFHNFFSFDLSSLTSPVISAKLELTRYTYASYWDSEVLGLFDVSTDAVTLNNNRVINLTIFNDLGTGVSYGEFEVYSEGLSTDVLSFELNAAALTDINAAMGGWFSIGGALLSPLSPGTLFLSSHDGGVQRLVLEVISEPTTLILFALGLVVLRKRRAT